MWHLGALVNQNEPHFCVEQMVDDRVRVLPESGDEHAQFEVRVLPAAHREIVGLRQDVYAVRKCALLKNKRAMAL